MPSKTIKAEKFNGKGNTIGWMNLNFNEIGPVTYITIEKDGGESGNSTRLCVKTDDLRAAFVEEEEDVEPEVVDDPIDESIKNFGKVLSEMSTIANRNYKAQYSLELYNQLRILRRGIKDGSVTATAEQKAELVSIGKRILTEGLGVSEDEVKNLTVEPGTDSVEEPK